MPCLHSASVPTRVPSTSRIASSKNSAAARPRLGGRVSIDGVHQGQDVGSGKRRQKSPGGGGVGDALAPRASR